MKAKLPNPEYVVGYRHGYDDAISDLDGLLHGYSLIKHNKEFVDFAKECVKYMRKKVL